MISNANTSLLALGLAAGTATGLGSLPQARDQVGVFSRSDVVIREAPVSHIAKLVQNKWRDEFKSPTRQRRQAKAGNQTINTVFSGVYPVVNVTWMNKAGSGQAAQHMLSFIDTGSSDTWAGSSDLNCSSIGSGQPLPQEACGFGNLYNKALGQFENLTDLAFNIRYFPENVTLRGDFGYAPLTIAGLTVPKQQVALVNKAAWLGDGSTSGLLGFGYAMDTSAKNRKTGEYNAYDPLFTNMVKQGIVDQAVFTLALDRVPKGTPITAPAGVLALGGLVPSSYYDGQFTSVAIEPATTGGVPYNASAAAATMRTSSAFSATSTFDGAKLKMKCGGYNHIYGPGGYGGLGGYGLGIGGIGGYGLGLGGIGVGVGIPAIVPALGVGGIIPGIYPGVLPYFRAVSNAVSKAMSLTSDPNSDVSKVLSARGEEPTTTSMDKRQATTGGSTGGATAGKPATDKALSWYATTHGLVYGPANGSSTTRVSFGNMQSIVDSGTAPCFVPTPAAKAINAMFDPPATFNTTLKYYTVPCDAKPPYVAYVVGGVEMPIDSRDAIFRSLNGLHGFEDTCFSSFADGGEVGNKDSDFIIGEVWQMGYVVSYDQGRSMMHFAKRTGFKTAA